MSLPRHSQLWCLPLIPPTSAPPSLPSLDFVAVAWLHQDDGGRAVNRNQSLKTSRQEPLSDGTDDTRVSVICARSYAKAATSKTVALLSGLQDLDSF